MDVDPAHSKKRRATGVFSLFCSENSYDFIEHQNTPALNVSVSTEVTWSWLAMGQNVQGSHRSRSAPYIFSTMPDDDGNKKDDTSNTNTDEDWLWHRCVRRTLSFPECDLDVLNGSTDTSLSSLSHTSPPCLCENDSEDVQEMGCAPETSARESNSTLSSFTSMVSKNVSANKNGDIDVRRWAQQGRCCHLSHTRDFELRNHNSDGKKDVAKNTLFKREQDVHQCHDRHCTSAKSICCNICPCDRQRIVHQDKRGNLEQDNDLLSPNSPIIDNLVIEPQSIIKFDPATKARIRKQVAKCLREEIQRANAYVEKEAGRARTCYDRNKQSDQQESKLPTSAPSKYGRLTESLKEQVNANAETFLEKLDSSLRKNWLVIDKRRKRSAERKPKDVNVRESTAHLMAKTRRRSPSKKANLFCQRASPSRLPHNFRDMHDGLRQKRVLKPAVIKPELRKQDSVACPRKQDATSCSRKHDSRSCTRRHERTTCSAKAPPRPCHHATKQKAAGEPEIVSWANRGQTPKPHSDKHLERSLYLNACNKRVPRSAPVTCLSTHTDTSAATHINQHSEAATIRKTTPSEQKSRCHLNERETKTKRLNQQLAFLERLPDDITQEEIRALMKVVVAMIERRLKSDGAMQDLECPPYGHAAGDGHAQDSPCKCGQVSHQKNISQCQDSPVDPKIFYSSQSADGLSCVALLKSNHSDLSTKGQSRISKERMSATGSEVNEPSTLTCVTKERGDLLDFLSEISNPQVPVSGATTPNVDRALPLFSDTTSDLSNSPFSTFTLASNKSAGSPTGKTKLAKELLTGKSAIVHPYDNFTLHNRQTKSQMWDSNKGNVSNTSMGQTFQDTLRNSYSSNSAIHHNTFNSSYPVSVDPATIGMSSDSWVGGCGGTSFALNVDKSGRRSTQIDALKQREDVKENVKLSVLPRARSTSNIDVLIFTDARTNDPMSHTKQSWGKPGTSLLALHTDKDESGQRDGKKSASTTLIHDRLPELKRTERPYGMASLPPCPHENIWHPSKNTNNPMNRHKSLSTITPTETRNTPMSSDWWQFNSRSDDLFSLGTKYKLDEKAPYQPRSCDDGGQTPGILLPGATCESFPSESSTRSSDGNFGKAHNDTYDLDAMSCSIDTVVTDTSISKRILELENDLLKSAIKDWRTSATRQYVRDLPQVPCCSDFSKHQADTVTSLNVSCQNLPSLESPSECSHAMHSSSRKDVKDESMTIQSLVESKDACRTRSCPHACDQTMKLLPEKSKSLTTKCGCTSSNLPPTESHSEEKNSSPQVQTLNSSEKNPSAQKDFKDQSCGQNCMIEESSNKSVSLVADQKYDSDAMSCTRTISKSSCDVEVTGSLSRLKANTDALLAEVYRKYYPDKYMKSMMKVDMPDLGKALDFLENFSPIQPADVNTRYPTLLENKILPPPTATTTTTTIDEHVVPPPVSNTPVVADLSKDTPAPKPKPTPIISSAINKKAASEKSSKSVSSKTGIKHVTKRPGTVQSTKVNSSCIKFDSSRGKRVLKERVNEARKDNVVIDVTSQHHIRDPLVVRTYNSKSAVPVSVRQLEAKQRNQTVSASTNPKLGAPPSGRHTPISKGMTSRGQKGCSTAPQTKPHEQPSKRSMGGGASEKKSENSQLQPSRSYTIETAGPHPPTSKDIHTRNSAKARNSLVLGMAGKGAEKTYSITNKSLSSEDSEMTSSSQLDTSEWNYSENNNSFCDGSPDHVTTTSMRTKEFSQSSVPGCVEDKSSSNKPRPSTKILGELAFQLERRILDYVFGLDGSKRRRFYGYTVSNICYMMERECKNTMGSEDPFVKTDMANRLKKVLQALRKRGYNIKEHSEFAQEMVNKYGLLACPPDAETIREFGLQDPSCIANLITQLANGPHETRNLTILLECLKYLSHCDGRPFFVW